MGKATLQLTAVFFGLVGLAGCFAVVFVLWNFEAKVNRATGHAFDVVDGSVAVVEQRLVQTQAQIRALKITTTELEQGVKKWATAATSKRDLSRIDAAGKVERLETGLRQADHWLELAESSASLVQRFLDAGRSIDAASRLGAFESLVKDLASLRTQLTQTIELMDTMRSQLETSDPGSSPGEPSNRFGQLTVRVIATLGLLDSRLDDMGNRLSEIRTSIRNASGETQWWIRMTAVGLSVLIAWMAAGQCALTFLGWQSWSRRRAHLQAL